MEKPYSCFQIISLLPFVTQTVFFKLTLLFQDLPWTRWEKKNTLNCLSKKGFVQKNSHLKHAGHYSPLTCTGLKSSSYVEEETESAWCYLRALCCGVPPALTVWICGHSLFFFQRQRLPLQQSQSEKQAGTEEGIFLGDRHVKRELI